MADNEKTSDEIASLAAKGLHSPDQLTLEEIRSVCASALTQAPDNTFIDDLDQSMVLHQHTITICDGCAKLDGEMCGTPECIFCRRTMGEVEDVLDKILVRPLVDGKPLFEKAIIGQPSD